MWMFSRNLTKSFLRRIRWILVAMFFASFLLINTISPLLPFVMVVIIAGFEHKANQIADLDTPGVEWAMERLEDEFEAGEVDPLESLKNQYVKGELSEEEFEERVDQLIQEDDDDDDERELGKNREREKAR